MTRTEFINGPYVTQPNQYNERFLVQRVVVVDSNGEVVDNFSGSSTSSTDTILQEIEVNTTGLAKDTSIQQLTNAITSQLNLAATLWTDNSGAYYIRRDIVDQGTGQINITFTNPDGSPATPGAGLQPISATNKEVLLDYYNVITSGTGYTIGDLLAKVTIINVDVVPPTSEVIWFNLTQNTIVGSVNSSHVQLREDTFNAVQSGAWNVGITGTLPLPIGAATENTLSILNNKISVTNTNPIGNENALIVRPITSGTQAVNTGLLQPLTNSELRASSIGVTVGNTPTVNLGTLNGAATSTLQNTGNTFLSNINNKIPNGLRVISNRLRVDGSGVTQPISAVSLPLPTGSATAANQVTGNTTLSLINNKLITSTTNPVGTENVPIFRAIPSGTQTVSGTLATTQSGSWDINNITGTVSLPTGAATSVLQTSTNTKLDTVISSITDVATENTLQQVLTSLNNQINLASTVWTDDSNAYYVRRETVTGGTVSVSFYNPDGTLATPGAGLKPIGDTTKTLFTQYYTATTANTGYVIGDLLSRLEIIDTSVQPPTSTTIWLNLTQDTIVASVVLSDLQRFEETVQAKQSGVWSVGVTGSLPLPIGAATEVTLTNLNSKITTLSSNPNGTESAVVVRTIPSGTQAITGTVNIGLTQPLTDTQLRASAIDVTVSNFPSTQDVSVTSTVLPLDAATASNQDIANTTLSSIDNKLGTGLALDSTLTDGTQKTIIRSGAKGTSISADITSTQAGLNKQPLDVIIYDTNGNAITSFGGGGGGGTSSTQYADGASAATPTGNQINWNNAGTQASVSLTQALPIQPGTGVSFPITATNLPLPTNAATSALQTTGNTSLSSIDSKLPANLTVTSTRLLVDNSGVTQPISAVSLPLPTGAATQTTLQLTADRLMPSTGTQEYVSMGVSAGANIKNSSGRVLNVCVTNLRASVDGSVTETNNVTRYFQLFNSTGVPSGTPLVSIPVYGNSGTLILGQDFLGGEGRIFAAGITWGISTTPLTYTAATASETIVNIRYI